VRLLAALLLVLMLALTLPPLAVAEPEGAVLLYQGHGSIRITTREGKVIYVDPYSGDGYDLPADLILVTHNHSDHNNTRLIMNKTADCTVITWKEALKGGERQVFDLGFITVEAVEAGNNKNHNVKSCVGYLLTLPEGVMIYISGDTSLTGQMAELASRGLDYAFFCCDGIYNMNTQEASQCAALVNARVSIPYHVAPGKAFDQTLAERFEAEGRLIVRNGEEIILNGLPEQAKNSP